MKKNFFLHYALRKKNIYNIYLYYNLYIRNLKYYLQKTYSQFDEDVFFFLDDVLVPLPLDFPEPFEEPLGPSIFNSGSCFRISSIILLNFLRCVLELVCSSIYLLFKFELLISRAIRSEHFTSVVVDIWREGQQIEALCHKRQ